MFSFLLGKLSPYGAMIKLIAIALLLVAVFGSGYKVSDWRWSAKYETEEVARQVAIVKSQLAARSLEAEQAARDRSLEAEHEAKVAKLNSVIVSLRDKIEGEKDESYQTADVQRPFTMQFVREFNSLSDGADHRTDVPATTENSSGVSGQAAATADLTRKDLLLSHAEQMNQCLAWKQQIDSIIEWDKQTFGGTQ